MYASPEHYVPQVTPTRRPFAMWLVVAAGTLLVIAFIIGAPWLLANGYEAIANTIYQGFSHVCHQNPDRSFFLAGHPFAVCSRCCGIYLGFTAASLAYPLIRSLRQTTAPHRKWLFIAATPLAIDYFLGLIGVWDNTHFSRFSTGALLGAVAVFYVMPGLMDLSLRRWSTKNVPKPSASGRPAANVLQNNVSTAPSDYSAPHRRI
ncbi:MAG TPA: DUF2085 domain-containing protein [Pyrinomonadaceae bacterium]|nr:DUF2085 domain-containing protein [Pyrinomonadaceae bacterium]